MGRRPAGDRILGPYAYRGRWRVVIAGADGTRLDQYAPTEAAAARLADALRAELTTTSRTVADALDEYERHLTAKGNKERSRRETLRRLRMVLDDQAQPLAWWTAKRAAARYRELAAGLAADSHRNYLAETRTLFRWAVRQGWLRANPWEAVEGVGRRSRGKPQLTVDEARRLARTALLLARTGEPWERDGAAGVLCALLLGLRASEITGRLVRDLDDEGRLLWIREAKTSAGNRVLEVPELLRPILLACADGRATTAHLLGGHWRDWVTEWTHRLCSRAGVPQVPAHGLRGTHATLAVEAGATGHLVASALGHEDQRTTMTSYARQEAQERRRQARAAMKVIPGGRK